MIALPEHVNTVIALLESAGFCAVIVGGCVRDALLGRVPTDWDVATSARPEEVERSLSGLRIHETGLQHGTVTAIINAQPVEITSFRLEGDYSDHRRPDAVAFTDDLSADLSRRDFTVNAMAWHPARGLRDPFGGTEDLQARILRCVGDPERRLEEDALRILRCLRFASVLDFAIEGATVRALLRRREDLRFVAAERIREELLKLLCGVQARRVLTDYRPVIRVILPQLELTARCFAVVEAAPADPALRLAALCDTCDPALALKVTRQLRCSRAFSGRVERLVRLRAQRLEDEPSEPLRSARLRRLLGEYGEEALEGGLALARAEALTDADARRVQTCEELQSETRALAERGACVSRKQLAVNGGDLTALGLRGPALGAVLDTLLEEVMQGQLENTRQALLKEAEKFTKNT